MSSHSLVYEFQVSKASPRRIPEGNIIGNARSLDEMKGL